MCTSGIEPVTFRHYTRLPLCILTQAKTLSSMTRSMHHVYSRLGQGSLTFLQHVTIRVRLAFPDPLEYVVLLRYQEWLLPPPPSLSWESGCVEFWMNEAESIGSITVSCGWIPYFLQWEYCHEVICSDFFRENNCSVIIVAAEDGPRY